MSSRSYTIHLNAPFLLKQHFKGSTGSPIFRIIFIIWVDKKALKNRERSLLTSIINVKSSKVLYAWRTHSKRSRKSLLYWIIPNILISWPKVKEHSGLWKNSRSNGIRTWWLQINENRMYVNTSLIVFITRRIAFIFVSSTAVHIYMIFIYLQSFVHHLEGLFRTNIMTSSHLTCSLSW